MKRNRLTNLLLKELSLVDHPANQHARVSLFKRATAALLGRSTPVAKSATELLQESLESIVKDDSLTPEERITLIDTSMDEFRDYVAKGDALELDDVEDEEVDKSHTPEDIIVKDDVLKGLSPAQRAHVESIEKSASDAVTKANEVVAKAQERERQEIAKGLAAGTTAKPEEVAALLKQLDEPGQTVLKSILGSFAAVTKASALLKEQGRDDATDPGTDGEIEKAAAEFQKADPKLTRAQAVTKAYNAHPELYEQSLATA